MQGINTQWEVSVLKKGFKDISWSLLQISSFCGGSNQNPQICPQPFSSLQSRIQPSSTWSCLPFLSTLLPRLLTPPPQQTLGTQCQISCMSNTKTPNASPPDPHPCMCSLWPSDPHPCMCSLSMAAICKTSIRSCSSPPC